MVTPDAAYRLVAFTLDSAGLPQGALGSLAGRLQVEALHGNIALAVGTGLAVPAQAEAAFLAGTTAGPVETLSITPADQSPPSVAWLGGRFLAAWTETSGTGTTTKWTLLDRQGIRVSAVRQARGRSLAVASSGFDAVLLTYDGRELIGTHIGTDGSVLSEVGVAETPFISGAAAAWVSSHYALVWDDRGSIYSSLLMPDGTAAPVRQVEIASPVAPPERFYVRPGGMRLAFSGADLLLVWQQSYYPSGIPMIAPRDPVALAARLDAHGRAIDRVATLVDADAPQRLSLAANADEFLLVTHDRHSVVRGMAIRTKPNLHVSASEVLFEAPATVAAEAIWTGRDFAVAIAHSANLSSIAVKYVTGDLRDSRSSRTVQLSIARRRPGDHPALMPANLSSDHLGNVLIATAELPDNLAFVATTYLSDELRLLGTPPPPPPRAQAVPLPAQYATAVTWEAPPGDVTWEGFVTRRLAPEVSSWPVLRGAQDRGAELSSAYESYPIVVQTFNEAGVSPPTLAGPPDPRRRASGR